MSRGRIVILSGPSGAGKTTLYKKILQDPDLKRRIVRSVSFTTRAPRDGERNGDDYFFISEPMFLYKRKAGHFLESENVVGNYYGTSRRKVLDRLKKGSNVLLCIDVKGAKSVAQNHPEALKIFVRPPSLEVLRKRLKNRGSEGSAHLEIRLKTAEKELKCAAQYDVVIENDELAKAYDQLKEVLQREL